MKKFHALSDAQWVLKAASKDEARPVLTGLYINSDELVATDGHRLHLVARNLPAGDMYMAGLWSDRPGEQVVGKFPDYWKVFPPIGSLRRLETWGLLPVLDAAIAYAKARSSVQGEVTFPADDGKFVAVNATYLRDILRGRLESDGAVLFQAPGPITPVTVFVAGLTRVACLMPIRRPFTEEGDRRFDLTEFCELPPVVAESEQAVAV